LQHLIKLGLRLLLSPPLCHKKVSLLKDPKLCDIEPGTNNQTKQIIKEELIANMYIPLPIELGIGLNLPVRLKLRKQLLNNINKRRNPNLRIDLILSRKIGPYQQNQQDHIGEVHHEDINDEETIAFGHGAMATVLDQTVDYFVEQQVDGQDYRGQGQHG
jgi:hypothetical protein